MAALDTKARATAFRLVKKYGKSVTYQKRTGESTQVYNETTGLFEDTPVFVSYQTKIAPPVGPKPDDLKDGQILASDLRFELPALGTTFDPTPNDRMVLDTVTWTVKRVKPQYSGDLIAYWDIFIGR